MVDYSKNDFDLALKLLGNTVLEDIPP